ncbi:hypothetical protein L9F63_007857, partial [Diploptera punctata]
AARPCYLGLVFYSSQYYRILQQFLSSFPILYASVSSFLLRIYSRLPMYLLLQLKIFYHLKFRSNRHIRRTITTKKDRIRRVLSLCKIGSEILAIDGPRAITHIKISTRITIVLTNRISLAIEVSFSPQGSGLYRMEALETAINYWDDALAAYTSMSGAGGPLAVTSVEEAEFSKDLQGLLDAAYRLQDQCELLFLDQRSVLFRTDSSTRLHGDTSTAITSSPESFVSAQDEVADLREFEEFVDVFPDAESLILYQSAVKKVEEGTVLCLRTHMVHCSSEGEFLAKLHCVRLAFQHLFKDNKTWLWFADNGRQMLVDLILYAEKDPKDFLIAYEDMLDFLQDSSKWASMEQELSLKGVKAMTFYDVVLDYILMDAFEDLESPPSSVTAVVQNRWLSDGFKETALTTAVWSVLKAKRKMLKFPNGFMSHFYAISEQMSPLMAWGFLGPDEKLKDMCQFFKSQVMGFLVDIFSFQKSHYTTVEELAEDLTKHLKARTEALSHKVSAPSEGGTI